MASERVLRCRSVGGRQASDLAQAPLSSLSPGDRDYIRALEKIDFSQGLLSSSTFLIFGKFQFGGVESRF